MKQTITKKIFTLIITSISIFSMGCGDDDKGDLGFDEEYNLRIYQPQLKIILTGMELDGFDEDELPKINMTINGDAHLVPLAVKEYTFGIELKEGDLYGITLEENYVQFNNDNLGSDTEFEPVYEATCVLHDAAGVAGDEMDKAVLICNVSAMNAGVIIADIP